MDMSNVSRPDGSQYDPYNPTVGMSGTQKFLAGAGKAVADLGRGAGQMMGMVSEENVAASRERDRPLMETGLGVAGNIAGNIAPFLATSMIPGANTYTGAALTGAAFGAMQPTTEQDNRLANTAIGGALGVAGQAGGNYLANALKNRTANLAATASRNAPMDETLQLLHTLLSRRRRAYRLRLKPPAQQHPPPPEIACQLARRDSHKRKRTDLHRNAKEFPK
jgi:hypothetical protein